MNLSMKQKQTHRHREHTCGFQGRAGEGWIGSMGLADANYYLQRMEKQQGPTVQHRELYPISCDKP